jgi:hypothetical protein
MISKGSVARLAMGFGRVEVHADHLEQSVQRTPFTGRGDSGVRPLGPTYPLAYEKVAELLAERGVEPDPQLHLSLGAGLRTQAQPTLPLTSEADEPKLPHGRDLYKGQRRRQISVSRRGLDGPNHPIPAQGQTGRERAKRFFCKALRSPGKRVPRVIHVGQNTAYPAAMEALQKEGVLPRRVRLRPCKYLNTVVEQDHRTVQKRTWLAKGYGSFLTAWRTLQGSKAVNRIRKGRAR